MSSDGASSLSGGDSLSSEPPLSALRQRLLLIESNETDSASGIATPPLRPTNDYEDRILRRTLRCLDSLRDVGVPHQQCLNIERSLLHYHLLSMDAGQQMGNAVRMVHQAIREVKTSMPGLPRTKKKKTKKHPMDPPGIPSPPTTVAGPDPANDPPLRPGLGGPGGPGGPLPPGPLPAAAPGTDHPHKLFSDAECAVRDQMMFFCMAIAMTMDKERLKSVLTACGIIEEALRSKLFNALYHIRRDNEQAPLTRAEGEAAAAAAAADPGPVHRPEPNDFNFGGETDTGETEDEDPGGPGGRLVYNYGVRAPPGLLLQHRQRVGEDLLSLMAVLENFETQGFGGLDLGRR
jgi:hypothetical protein